jgi:hypothetical protein
MRFTVRDIQPGDWIKYTDEHGASQLAEVRAHYPFGREPQLDTTRGYVNVSDVTELRKKPKVEHTCDSNDVGLGFSHFLLPAAAGRQKF